MHMVVVLLCRGWGELLLVLAVVMTAGLVVPATLVAARHLLLLLRRGDVLMLRSERR
jgi:hypothetical protein